MNRADIAATCTCECGKVYLVQWNEDGTVDGLPPVECECGILSEQLEPQARLHLDEEARYWLRERDEDVRRQGRTEDSPSYRDAVRDAGRGRLL